MAEREGFFMTLPSDGSAKTFPENTLAVFKTLLPQTLNLTEGEWEVALTEVMYASSIENLSKEEAYVDVVYEEKYKQYVKDPDATKTGRFKTSQVAGITVENIMPITDWKHSFYNNNYLIPEEKTLPVV